MKKIKLIALALSLFATATTATAEVSEISGDSKMCSMYYDSVTSKNSLEFHFGSQTNGETFVMISKPMYTKPYESKREAVKMRFISKGSDYSTTFVFNRIIQNINLHKTMPAWIIYYEATKANKDYDLLQTLLLDSGVVAVDGDVFYTETIAKDFIKAKAYCKIK